MTHIPTTSLSALLKDSGNKGEAQKDDEVTA